MFEVEETLLQAVQFFLILRPIQGQAQVEAIEDRLPFGGRVGWHGHGGRLDRRRRRATIHFGPDRLNHGLEHLGATVAALGGLDHGPWGVGRAGPLDHLLDRLEPCVVLAMMTTFPFADLPSRRRVFLQTLETPLLFFLVDMQPELDDHHAGVGQLPRSNCWMSS